MITKNHPSAYAELFKRAEEALSNYGSESFKSADIKNIDDYFACLAELARIEEMHPESIDPIFTILPATEQTFNIDADKRTIAIPDNFAKYGVGVQGDEIAEILYFSIDRYFDAMDLADMDIIVQWRHEKDDPTLDGWLSATYKKSLTLQPGKIVFGWPITSEITERSGNIKFSIRFYRRENNELIYSFSTLTATIKIQTGLDFALNENATNLQINKNSQIYRNLRNSKKANIDYVIAAPSFTDYYIQTEESEDLVPATQFSYDLPVTFVVKAEIPKTTPDDQQISGAGLTYSWHNKENKDTVLTSSYLYRPVDTEKENYNPKEIYYFINEDKQYEPYYIVGDNNPFDDEIELFVRCNSFEPNIAGTYYAVASNVYAPGAYTSVSSTEWVVPGPTDPVFNYSDEDKKLLLSENKANVIIGVEANGVVTGEWYKSVNANFGTDAIKVSDAIFSEDNTSTYEATEEGYYFLKANNTKNNATINTASSGVWVRHHASMPVITVVSNNKPIGEALGISVTVPEPGKGIISYQWFNAYGPIEGATDSAYTPLNTGSYKCTVRNTYKETYSEATTEDWLNINPS